MKFMFMIYHDENELRRCPRGRCRPSSTRRLDYDDEIRRSGHYIVSDALQPARTARTIRRPRLARSSTTDGPVRRDQGAARRILPHRGQGHGRGVRGGLAVSPARIGIIEVRPVRS